MKHLDELKAMAKAMQDVADEIPKGTYKNAREANDAVRAKSKQAATEPSTQPAP